MLLSALHQVDKYYGEQTVLDGVTLEVRAASRVALIGRNGSGKSTMLRLLMGREAVDGGSIYLRPQTTIAMLQQDPAFEKGFSVLEVSERAFAELDELERRLQELERQGLDKPEVYARWESVHETFERRGGYERRSRRDSVLHALGFRGREDDEAVTLSGGEKTRLGLAILLMAQPDTLLLDEPTNHLDMAMRAWLEGYLGRYPGGVVLVSHDRAFLDAACSSTAEISLGRLRSFEGTPTMYRAHREEQLRIEEATRRNEQRELERLDHMTEQMKLWAGNNAKLARRAKSMATRRDRYAAQMQDEPDAKERTTRFRFETEPSAEIVLQGEHLSKAFGGRSLFEDLSLTIRQGERIALVGPNGAGKSSFLKVLLGDLPSDDPRAVLRYGARVRVGYYDQELRGVNPELTLIEEMIRLVGDVEAHNLLGRFLFPYEAQFKRVADLSGGERARLALLKLTLGGYNFLILDEPTNHLDVEMIEALEAALAGYEGTLLMVSHDRRFIRDTAGSIWDLRDGNFTTYPGGWDYYLRKRGEGGTAEEGAREAPSHGNRPATKRTAGPSKWKLERILEELEEKIAGLEAELDATAERLARPDDLDPAAISRLGTEHARLEAELLEAMARWEESSERLIARA